MTFTYHLCTTVLPAHAGTEANSSWLHNKHEKTWVTGHDGDQAASVPLGYDGIRMPDWFPVVSVCKKDEIQREISRTVRNWVSIGYHEPCTILSCISSVS